MDWSKGYESRYYAMEVDPISWRDIEPLDIISGSISRSASGLQESADLVCRNFDASNEKWLRLYIDTNQAGNTAHLPIFTGMAASPDENWDGNVVEHPIQCYSVLKPAEDVPLQRGWYAPVDVNGARLIRKLLSETVFAPVSIMGESPNLRQAVIAEQNENHLTMVYKILNAINWRLRIEGDGTIVLEPKASEVSARFDYISNDSIQPQVSKTRDWFSCPNVFRVTSGDTTAVARDDDPNSPLSTVSRRREIWAYNDNVTLTNGESITECARRMLKEAQAVYLSVSYTRRYMPDVLVGDIVQLHYPKQGIDGLFRVTSQGITLGYSADTSEEVVQID